MLIKTQIDPTYYITPQNPYNKQVFIEANLHFSTVINL